MHADAAHRSLKTLVRYCMRYPQLASYPYQNALSCSLTNTTLLVRVCMSGRTCVNTSSYGSTVNAWTKLCNTDFFLLEYTTGIDAYRRC